MNTKMKPSPAALLSLAMITMALTGAIICTIAGCAPNTAATVNRDITTAIAGAGAAANEAEQYYNNKQIAQTDTNRKAINDLGAAYTDARNAFITVLNAESVYRGAQQLQLIACSPATVKPANPPAVDCAQTTQNVTNAQNQVQAAEQQLNTKIATLSTQTKSVQALK